VLQTTHFLQVIKVLDDQIFKHIFGFKRKSIYVALMACRVPCWLVAHFSLLYLSFGGSSLEVFPTASKTQNESFAKKKFSCLVE